MDAGNLLKPMLARGELHCIGATTLDEYRQYIEKDPALERRFQPVQVDEPTVEDTISIDVYKRQGISCTVRRRTASQPRSGQAMTSSVWTLLAIRAPAPPKAAR